MSNKEEIVEEDVIEEDEISFFEPIAYLFTWAWDRVDTVIVRYDKEQDKYFVKPVKL